MAPEHLSASSTLDRRQYVHLRDWDDALAHPRSRDATAASAAAVAVLLVVLLCQRRKGRRLSGHARPMTKSQSKDDVLTEPLASAEKRPRRSSGFGYVLRDYALEVCRDVRAIPLLIALALSLVGGSAAAVALTFAQKDYITALSERDSASFFEAIRYSIIGLSLTLLSKCVEEFSASALSLVWRDVLVERLLASFFTKHTAHWLLRGGVVRDPDARIAQDAHHFAEAASLFLRDVLKSVLRLTSFSVVVARISPTLLVAMLLYAGLGTFVTIRVFGAPMVRIERTAREQQQSFRRSLSSCFEGAEGMAMSGGACWEAQRASERYAELRRTSWQRVRLRVPLAAFREAWSWASQLLPIVLLGPLYLSGQLDLGSITQAALAFKISLDVLSMVVHRIRSVATLTSEGQRLETLRQELGVACLERSGNTVESPQGPPGVVVENLTLWRPGGDVQNPLLRSLSLTAGSGMRLLVTGSSGCGKTTLLRSLLGLWAGGSGKVSIAGRAILLPQVPYLPLGVTLYQLLSFPSDARHSEAEVQRAMIAVGLQGVAERFATCGTADWKTVLSVGEQQRVAFARLLLDKPDVALLDEATSALDEGNEALLYETLDTPVVISVGHRSCLRKCHTHVLNYVGQGQWDLSLSAQWWGLDS